MICARTDALRGAPINRAAEGKAARARMGSAAGKVLPVALVLAVSVALAVRVRAIPVARRFAKAVAPKKHRSDHPRINTASKTKFR